MSSPVTYWNPTLNRGVLIDKSVINLLRSFRQIGHTAQEGGGVLIGEMRGQHFWIREASPPQEDDLRTRTTFFRRSRKHQRTVDEAWRLSGGTLRYVGEWHTHPEDDPTPSIVDRAGLILRAAQSRQTLLVMIVGIRAEYVALQDGLTLSPCELQST